MGEFPNLREHLTPCRCEPTTDQLSDLLTQRVNIWVAMSPGIYKTYRVERLEAGMQLIQSQEVGPFRHEETNRQLNRRDLVDELQAVDFA